jgi:hypothetical protein
MFLKQHKNRVKYLKQFVCILFDFTEIYSILSFKKKSLTFPTEIDNKVLEFQSSASTS